MGDKMDNILRLLNLLPIAVVFQQEDKEKFIEFLEDAKIADVARAIKEIKSTLEQADKAKKELQKLYDYITVSLAPERMAEEEISTMKIDNVGRLQCSPDLRCSCPAENKEMLKKWLVDNGHKALISDTINSSSLKAFVREMISTENELIKEGRKPEKPLYPKDILKIEPFSRATVVKA